MLTYLSLGSNLGDKEQNLNQAVELIATQVGRICRRSSLFYSAPWGFSSNNSFVNICIAVDTSLSPTKLLNATQAIEQQMGRTEKSQNGIYHDRIIDIDILLYGNRQINLPNLTIPHPLMQQRNFVMMPLQEITQSSDSDSLV